MARKITSVGRATPEPKLNFLSVDYKGTSQSTTSSAPVTRNYLANNYSGPKVSGVGMAAIPTQNYLAKNFSGNTKASPGVDTPVPRLNTLAKGYGGPTVMVNGDSYRDTGVNFSGVSVSPVTSNVPKLNDLAPGYSGAPRANFYGSWSGGSVRNTEMPVKNTLADAYVNPNVSQITPEMLEDTGVRMFNPDKTINKMLSKSMMPKNNIRASSVVRPMLSKDRRGKNYVPPIFEKRANMYINQYENEIKYFKDLYLKGGDYSMVKNAIKYDMINKMVNKTDRNLIKNKENIRLTAREILNSIRNGVNSIVIENGGI